MRRIINTNSSIEVGLSRTTRVLIAFESGEKLYLPKRIVSRYRLRRIKDIDDDMYKEILTSLYKYELSYCLRWLGNSERSEAELRKRLKQRQVPQDVINEVIDKLSENNYLCDERAAEAMIRSLTRKGYGPSYIRKKMYEKGLKAEEVLFEKVDFHEVCRQAFDKYMARRKESNPMKKRQLALNHLTRRGFRYDMIREVIGSE
ncbi:RecX family transcriptional regulator [bacterium]|nr:RecX family transcriptional regulator [bacterium]MCK5600119.1 RecX family transcriptional regulator [bacterium]